MSERERERERKLIFCSWRPSSTRESFLSSPPPPRAPPLCESPGEKCAFSYFFFLFPDLSVSFFLQTKA